MREETIQALRRLKVETGSMACMGCGHEHSCSTRGCAILREAADEVANGNTHIVALQKQNQDLNDALVQQMKAAELAIEKIAAERDALMDAIRGDCMYCAHDKSGLEEPCKLCSSFAAKEFVTGCHWELAGVPAVAKPTEDIPEWAEHLRARFERSE